MLRLPGGLNGMGSPLVSQFDQGRFGAGLQACLASAGLEACPHETETLPTGTASPKRTRPRAAGGLWLIPGVLATARQAPFPGGGRMAAAPALPLHRPMAGVR